MRRDLRRPLPASPGRACRPRRRGPGGPGGAYRHRAGRGDQPRGGGRGGRHRSPRVSPTAVLDTCGSKVGDLSPEVTAQLAALGAIPTAGAQQDRNSSAVARWQDYLGQLAAAGIVPPPAAAIADATHLPPGMSPALDGNGQPVPGVVWAVIGNSPVTVLPAETVVAVSTALSQLGKPFVGGTSGPDTYDCGGLTSAAWLLAGFAVPSTPENQWATGAPVDVTALQVGDLVFSPGGQDVGIYLGDGDVVGASAATYQVGVRSVAPGSSATRVTLPAPAAPNAALPATGDTAAWAHRCRRRARSTPPGAGTATARSPARRCARWAWPATRCAATPRRPTRDERRVRLHLRVAAVHHRLLPVLRQPGVGVPPQAGLAAFPGTSNHGWALAVDLCGGINVAGRAQWGWMTANAGRFGFVKPDWARPGAEKPEPWHWEFGDIS